jgi:hypothetical protein
MAKYFVSIDILSRPVMCSTIEAASPSEARAVWEKHFWESPHELRKAIPAMDGLNRAYAAQMLDLMEQTRERARLYGITVRARRSYAKG